MKRARTAYTQCIRQAHIDKAFWIIPSTGTPLSICHCEESVSLFPLLDAGLPLPVVQTACHADQRRSYRRLCLWNNRTFHASHWYMAYEMTNVPSKEDILGTKTLPTSLDLEANPENLAHRTHSVKTPIVLTVQLTLKGIAGT